VIESIASVFIAFGKHFLAMPYSKVVLLLLMLWYLAKIFRHFNSKSRISKLFNIPNAEYTLVGTDLNTWLPACKLFVSGITGKPDAAYINYRSSHGIIGEYKSRKYKGNIKLYERYQVTLYMGMLKSKYRLKEISGRLRYADKCVDVPFDPDLYRRLVLIRDEAKKSLAKGRPINPLPIYKR